MGSPEKELRADRGGLDQIQEDVPEDKLFRKSERRLASSLNLPVKCYLSSREHDHDDIDPAFNSRARHLYYLASLPFVAMPNDSSEKFQNLDLHYQTPNTW